jgi:hypothetical protein
MMKVSRVVFIAVCLLLVVLLVGSQFYAPPQGCALDARARAIARLKNRTGVPTPADFDPRVTLATMITPGDDRERWSEARAAVIEGYVVEVFPGGPEATNCFSHLRVDTHIALAPRPDAPLTERVVTEVTPPARDLAAKRGEDWSLAALKRTLIGHRCRITGWLFYDGHHAGESVNTEPFRPENWRATAWELHPVTDIRILD